MGILDDIRQFLQVLEAIQDEQSTAFQAKRDALRTAKAPVLRALAEQEVDLTRRLQLQLARRQQILQKAAAAGLPAQSLESAVSAIRDAESAPLRARIARARERSEVIRRENLTHWIVAQRAFHHYSELLELIAHRGQKSPTYAIGAARESAGGAILDASA
jgi:hypothetical protein